jgi:hypothetical protein
VHQYFEELGLSLVGVHQSFLGNLIRSIEYDYTS